VFIRRKPPGQQRQQVSLPEVAVLHHHRVDVARGHPPRHIVVAEAADHDPVLGAGGGGEGQRVVDERVPGHLDERLGHRHRQVAEPRPQPCRHDDRLRHQAALRPMSAGSSPTSGTHSALPVRRKSSSRKVPSRPTNATPHSSASSASLSESPTNRSASR
jgi:hypothetical protein